MERFFAVLGIVGALLAASASSASAQVVIQGEVDDPYGQSAPYGQGNAILQPIPEPQPLQPQPYGAPYTYQPGQETRPARTIVHTAPMTALLVPGIAALGGGWLVHGLGSLAVARECETVRRDCPGSSLDDAYGWAALGWIPIAGPWLALGVYPADHDWVWFNAVLGVVQGVGAVLTLLGIVIQEEWEEVIYVDLGRDVRLAFDGGGSQIGATLRF